MSLEQDLLLLRNAAKNPPDPAQLDEIFALLEEGEPYTELFYSNLEHRDWLAILRHRGFDEISAPTKAEDRSILDKIHPILFSLRRFTWSAPAEVSAILSELPESEIISGGREIMRCMVAIKDSAQLEHLLPVARRIIFSENRPIPLFLCDLLVVWMDLGGKSESLALLDEYAQSVILSRAAFERDIGAACELWKCDQDVLNPLTGSDPMLVSELCFRNLCAFAEASKEANAKRPHPDPNDLCAEPVWEGFPPTHWLIYFKESSPCSTNPTSTLAHRLYGAAHRIYAGGNDEERQQLDTQLRSHEWELFSRLRWQLYSDFPEVTLRWVRSDVLPLIPGMGQMSQEHQREFSSMLKVHSDRHGTEFLNADEVGALVAAVRAGPITGDDEPEMPSERQECFHFHQLWPLNTILPEEELAFLDCVASERAARSRPEFSSEDFKPVPSSGPVEEKSPFSQLDLAALDDGELWDTLNNWHPKNLTPPSEEREEETLGRLAEEFCKLLDADPNRFPTASQWWENIKRPRIMRRVMEHRTPEFPSTFEQLETPLVVDLEAELEIAQYIVSQQPVVPRQDADQASEESAEAPDWQSARMAVAHWLRRALYQPQTLPEQAHPLIRSLLSNLITEEDPRLDHLDPQETRDWLIEALNSVRGTATDMVLQIAHTQKETVEDTTGAIEDWIPDLLGSRLEAEVNESPAFFALLGYHLRSLAILLPEWLRNNQTQLFADGRSVHRAAALRSYFGSNGPAKLLIETIPDLPQVALNDLAARSREQTEDGEDSPSNGRNVTSRIGYHIAFYCWNGLLEQDNAESLLAQFYDLASPSARGEFIRMIGSALDQAHPTANNPEPVKENSEQLQRATALLDERLVLISTSIEAAPGTIDQYQSELGQFADLVAAECFDFDWRVRTATTALDLLTIPPRPFQLLDTLEKWSANSKRLPAATSLLCSLTSHLSDELDSIIRPMQIRPMIQRGLAHADPGVRHCAETARENLLRAGFFFLLDLDDEARASAQADSEL